MKKKIFYTFAVLLCSVQILIAQTNPQAEKILSDLLASVKTTAVKVNFKLTVNDKKVAEPQTTNGTFLLKGTKFVLEMEAMKVWFDGKTQWSYLQQNNEVSVTEPSEKELSETNPMAILSGFKSKCFIRFSSKVKSDKNYCIEMISKVKNNDILKIDVQVNKSSGNLFSISLINKNGSTSLLTLSNFQKELNVSDNIFVFNNSKYKGVNVNDLR